MYEWQKHLSLFYGRHPWILRLTTTSVLWLGVAMLLAFYPTTREMAIIPLILAVVVMSLQEFIPLSPIPLNVYNVVSSGYGRYVSALFASLAALVLAGGCGILVMVSEKMGNVFFFYEWEKQMEPESYWDKEMSWMNLFLIVLPIVYISSLLAHDKASIVIPSPPLS